MSKTDFRNKSDNELFLHLIEHQPELDMEGQSVDELTSHYFKIEKRSYGYAVLQQMDWGSVHIWALYISPESRNRKIGRKFVRELVSIHGKEYCMTLNCYGARRSRFFQNCGFRVTDWNRETGLRELQQK